MYLLSSLSMFFLDSECCGRHHVAPREGRYIFHIWSETRFNQSGCPTKHPATAILVMTNEHITSQQPFARGNNLPHRLWLSDSVGRNAFLETFAPNLSPFRFFACCLHTSKASVRRWALLSVFHQSGCHLISKPKPCPAKKKRPIWPCPATPAAISRTSSLNPSLSRPIIFQLAPPPHL